MASILAIALLLTCTATTANVATASSVPYTESKFRPVLDRAKLQEYTLSGNKVTSPTGLRRYSSSNFRRLSSGNLQFRMKGASKRCELREMTSGGNEAAWSISSSNTMNAKVSIPSQQSGLNEVTFLQVHCDVGPLLRISWMRRYSNSRLFSCTDCVVAHVRYGSGSGDVNKFYIRKRHANYKSYKVRVKNRKLSIWLGNTKVLNEKSVNSYWNKKGCNFKAGAYVNNPDKNSAVARMKFSILDWS